MSRAEGYTPGDFPPFITITIDSNDCVEDTLSMGVNERSLIVSGRFSILTILGLALIRESKVVFQRHGYLSTSGSFLRDYDMGILLERRLKAAIVSPVKG